ncbi:MAG: response regulator [Verrucomicrobiota bacterium]
MTTLIERPESQSSRNAPPPPSTPLGRILFADDDEQFRISLGERLKRAGFICDFAMSADEAVTMLRSNDYDVLLSDINMPGNVGLELVKNIPSLTAGLPIVLLTGNPTVETAMRSVQMRVVAYLVKPPDFTELCNTLTAAVVEHRNLRILTASRSRLQDWDREIEQLQRLLQQPATSDRPSTMRQYLRVTLRNLVLGLVELESLFLRDDIGLGAGGVIERQNLLNAVRKTIGVLQRTKDHFKSKELAELRKDLELLLKESRDEGGSKKH